MEEMAGEGEKGWGEKCWKEREGLEMEEIAGKGEKGWKGREVLREGRAGKGGKEYWGGMDTAEKEEKCGKRGDRGLE